MKCTYSFKTVPTKANHYYLAFHTNLVSFEE